MLGKGLHYCVIAYYCIIALYHCELTYTAVTLDSDTSAIQSQINCIAISIWFVDYEKDFLLSFWDILRHICYRIQLDSDQFRSFLFYKTFLGVNITIQNDVENIAGSGGIGGFLVWLFSRSYFSSL